MRYAQDTQVSCERSKAEIEETIRRYGADGFQSGWQNDKAGIMFRCHGKAVKFILPLPSKDAFKTAQKWGKERELSPEEAYKLWEQACRQRWRALALCIKAKLEAVECEIATFEQEFYANIVVPGTKGLTMYEFSHKGLEEAYATNKAPQLGWEG